MLRTVLPAILLLPVAALAQAQPQSSPQERALVAAVQQIIASVDIYASEMQRQLTARDREIADLLQRCGDACRSSPKVADK